MVNPIKWLIEDTKKDLEAIQQTSERLKAGGTFLPESKMEELRGTKPREIVGLVFFVVLVLGASFLLGWGVAGGYYSGECSELLYDQAHEFNQRFGGGRTYNTGFFNFSETPTNKEEQATT